MRIDTPDGKSGVITFVRQVCPGVFYIGVQDDDTPLLRDFYVASIDAVPSVLSEEAAWYGVLFNDMLFFEEGIPGSGWEIVDFEVSRYRQRRGVPLDSDNLYLRSRIYCERYPEYFGGLAPPVHTPFGRVIRTKKAAEGLYFVETEKLRWLLAVHHLIWQSDDLSDDATRLGIMDAWDGEWSYMFFTLENSTPAIYELLALKLYHGLLRYIQSKEALAAELYRSHPYYVISHNLTEIFGFGLSGVEASLLQKLGIADEGDEDGEEALARLAANCITLPFGQDFGDSLFLLP